MPTVPRMYAAMAMTLFWETSSGRTLRCDLPGHTQAAGDRPGCWYTAAAGKPRLGLLLGACGCAAAARDPGGLRLCRYGRTASCAEGAVFGGSVLRIFHKSHKFLPSFRADTRSRHAAAVSLRINFYCFYYNKFDFGCKCLSGNFKKTSAALPMFCLRLRKRVKHTHFSKIKPGF